MASSTFVTQPRVNLDEYPADDVNDLEALVSGVTQTSQSTLLLKKRKKMREIDEALELQKAKYAESMREFAERQRAFEEEQAKLRSTVMNFAPYIQKNDGRRAAALERAKTEQKQREANERRLEELEKQLEELEKRRKEKERLLNRHKRYEEFLKRVLNADSHADTYSDVNDLLNRHKTLQDAYDALRSDVTAKERRMDETRTELMQMVQAQQNDVLVMNSQIHRLQKDLERLRSEWFKHDMRKEHSERTMKEKIRESGQVIMSIRNLHNRCMTSYYSKSKVKGLSDKQQPTLEHLVSCLHQIQHRIVDVQQIHEAWQKAKLEQERDESKSVSNASGVRRARSAVAASGAATGATAAAASSGGAGLSTSVRRSPRDRPSGVSSSFNDGASSFPAGGTSVSAVSGRR